MKKREERGGGGGGGGGGGRTDGEVDVDIPLCILYVYKRWFRFQLYANR